MLLLFPCKQCCAARCSFRLSPLMLCIALVIMFRAVSRGVNVNVSTHVYLNIRTCNVIFRNTNTVIIYAQRANVTRSMNWHNTKPRPIRPDKLDLLFLISHFLDLGAGGRLLFITSLFNLISDFSAKLVKQR